MHKPKKELGQNFLTDFVFVKKMVESLEIKKDDLVVEIGPGQGAVTEEISGVVREKDAVAIAVEVDDRFVEELEEKFENIEIIEADILTWLANFTPGAPFKIIGSLPYYITSPILHAIVRHSGQITLGVLLMQKEVAKKLASSAPDASYLSTYAQTFFEVEFLEIVPREKFDPVPKVDGAIVKLKKRTGQDELIADISLSYDEKLKYEKFLHRGFSKPRKMLNKVFSVDLLTKLKIDSSLRPQHLQISDWLKLYKKCKKQ